MNDNKFLTEVCDSCNGTGKTNQLLPNSNTSTNEIRCIVCKGTGKLPNKDGIDILNLVKAFGKKI